MISAPSDKAQPQDRPRSGHGCHSNDNRKGDDKTGCVGGCSLERKVRKADEQRRGRAVGMDQDAEMLRFPDFSSS